MIKKINFFLVLFVLVFAEMVLAGVYPIPIGQVDQTKYNAVRIYTTKPVSYTHLTLPTTERV